MKNSYHVLAIIAPWTIRDYLVSHAFIPTATGEGTAWLGDYNNKVLISQQYPGLAQHACACLHRAAHSPDGPALGISLVEFAIIFLCPQKADRGTDGAE